MAAGFEMVEFSSLPRDCHLGNPAGPAGHHGACHRGAVFRTRPGILLPLPATTPACPGGAMFPWHAVGGGTRRGDGQRRQPRLNIAPRRQAAWWRGYGLGGRVSGAEHRSTEASSAVAAIPPLARFFDSHRRRLRSSLSAIAFPESKTNVRVVSRNQAIPAMDGLGRNRPRHGTRRKKRLPPLPPCGMMIAGRMGDGRPSDRACRRTIGWTEAAFGSSGMVGRSVAARSSWSSGQSARPRGPPRCLPPWSHVQNQTECPSPASPPPPRLVRVGRCSRGTRSAAAIDVEIGSGGNLD